MKLEKGVPWDRKSRRQAKEWSITDFLGRGKQGPEQVAFIQQLLNPQNKKFVEKIASMLSKRATGR